MQGVSDQRYRGPSHLIFVNLQRQCISQAVHGEPSGHFEERPRRSRRINIPVKETLYLSRGDESCEVFEILGLDLLHIEIGNLRNVFGAPIEHPRPPERPVQRENYLRVASDAKGWPNLFAKASRVDWRGLTSEQ